MNKNLFRVGMLCLMMLATIAAKAQGDVTATWDFAQDPLGLSGGSFQSETRTVDSNGITLTIDATTGKVRDNANSYQMTTGVKVKVPVTSAKDSVIVIGYPKYYAYTINGEAATNETTAHRVSQAEATQGYSEIVSTSNNNYLVSIKVVHVSPIQEKELYSTGFENWQEINRKSNNSTPTVVNLNTKYSHENFNMTLCGVGVDPVNVKNGFTGWMISAKFGNEVNVQSPYAMTSPLANITKIKFYQFATGGNRGWSVAVKGDGDTDWVPVYTQAIGNSKGEEVSIDINRTNCQLKFYNFNDSQNSYMDWLKIYGNVDMSTAPALASFTANGITYTAADVFNENQDGDYETTIEVSKTGNMISESNPLTNLEADNGTIGTVTYTTNADGTCTVTIPVSLGEETVNYIVKAVWKPDFTVTYYDTDFSTILGTQTVEKDAAITTFAKGAEDVSVTTGNNFRGWLLSTETGEKANENTVITGNTNLYALVTDIEGDEPNERHSYNLKDKFFYVEDHEGFVPTSAYSYNGAQHGLNIKAGSVKLLVGGNATIIVEACKYNKSAMTLSDAKGNLLATIDIPANDGAKTTVKYQGEAGELVLAFEDEIYLHSLTVISTGTGDIVKNDAGYYVAEPGNADSFWNILDIIAANEDGNSRVKIFLPNGTYDLGQAVETQLPCSNISIVGQDMDKTILLTTPPFSKEGLGSADMFYLVGTNNTYFQDLTLKNALDYYNSGSAGRAAVLQDRSTRTIGKNVKMLSYQDTYYSQNSAMQSYWEDCDIHGTVDFICGGGDVRFQNTTISLEPRNYKTGSGGRTVTAPTTTTDFGYVFDGCKVVDLANGKGDWNLGRTWQNNPVCVWLNSTFDANANATLVSKRWTEKGMNNRDPKVFGEYGTKDEAGNDITPASNKIKSYGGEFETILTADQAANYSYEKMFTDWDPKALAAQLDMTPVTAEGTTLTWDAVEGAQAYAIFLNDQYVGITTATTYALDNAVAEGQTYTVRAANGMGGFGKAATATTGIEAITEEAQNVKSIVYYNANGMQLSTPQQGVNIRVKTLANGKTLTDKVIIR